ncbi:MAG: 5-formyltetrahydrofolate cyclo-ligase [Pseudomonadota bacterium]|nr:5-formyltetrahydrofolate cyclo-ligase [Pseudomonadota bacterium]MEE2820973.1 5-formyltetrahydrofolate cyclo-ligase [Pseudomonadota bacterium]
MSKDTLRGQLLETRNRLSNETRRELSLSISKHLRSALPTDISRIGSYMAFGSEVDLQWLHHEILASVHRLYVPRVLSKTTMEMVALDHEEQVTEGTFGIVTSLQEETIDFGALDWLIMPCSGFDQRGYRLGMGGGFYDRALEHCEPDAPLRVGVAFAIQQAIFEPDPWDQPLDWVVTEDGFIRR